jgi:hypothetical protein
MRARLRTWCRDLLGPVLRSILLLVLASLVTRPATAQIQQAWVAHYNNGITNGTNQAVKMALDSNGNIYVTGFSQNTNTNLGYVTIKYAANGQPLWTNRYDATNFPAATPTALALDSSNNVVITGSAVTVKYDSNGNQLWTAPYAGTALAVDSNGDLVVTGISTSFGTVKLNPNGSNLWSVTYPSSYGPGLGQQIALAADGSAYVVGSYTWTCVEGPCAVEMLAIKYASDGTQLWTASYSVGDNISVHIGGTALDKEGNLYLVADFNPGFQQYITLKYSSSSGSLVWAASNPTRCGTDVSHGLVLDRSGNVIVTGRSCRLYPDPAQTCGTYEANTNGLWIWTNNFPMISTTVAGGGNAIALDAGNNSYVTGFAIESNLTYYGMVTLKYDQNGNQIWLQQYSSEGGGNASGNAIAVGANGNVYVAGYDTTAAGGTEMVLIKYSPVVLQPQPNGTVILQAQGSPGESFDIQASADLLHWLDLGTFLADTNGLMQFTDTNAPASTPAFITLIRNNLS